MRALLGSLAVGVILVAGACDGGGGGTSGAQVRDSAGIAIVESGAPRLDSSRAWRLSDAPRLTIGGPDATGPDALYRVASAVRLGDGRIIIVDGGTAQVRYFDAGGAYLTAAGGKGEGPGEFRAIGRATALPGDSLAVSDYMTPRLTLFDDSARLARVIDVPADAAAGGFLLLGRLSGGAFVGSGGRNAMYRGLGDGVRWDEAWVVSLPPEGAASTRILEYEGSETIVARGGHASLGAPFLRSRRPVLAGNGIVLADNTDYELRYYDVGGTLERVARRPWAPRPVTKDDVDRFRERLASTPLKGALDGIDMPETYPAFTDLKADREGNLWVRDQRPAGDEGPETWSVFDGRGAWITDVRVPSSFHVMDVGGDYVLGVWRDDMDVEQVRLYGLVKGAGTP